MGCATVRQTMSLGAGMGAAGGAASGALIARRMKGKAAIEMGVVMAILGGLSGHLIHKGIEAKGEKVRRKILFDLENYGEEELRGGGVTGN